MLMQTFRTLNGTGDAGKAKRSKSFYKESSCFFGTIEETFALNMNIQSK